MSRFDRTRMLIGDGVDLLASKHVIVFGVGGVGSYVVEALARTGIGALTLVDCDVVEESNINRQLIALSSTIGKRKVDVAAERVRDINPVCRVTPCFARVDAENAASWLEGADFAVDAIDCVTAKLALIGAAAARSVPIISCMGTGNKMDPSQLKISDLSKTTICPLARVMRKELRARGIKHCPVLYSTEEPKQADPEAVMSRTPGSISFVPSSAGLMIAGYVVTELLKKESPDPGLDG
ncbi:MAG: tRNA threonylcarbamoyladenosine dehydratase [Clostridia bacterium]|nr:tRNA threonylcarbamoyladenosine dehydratase [Clostridia bacterium]